MSKQKTATNSRKGGGKKTKTGAKAAPPPAATKAGKRSRTAKANKIAKEARD